MTVQQAVLKMELYGAFELKALYKKHLSFGLIFSVSMLLIGIAVYFVVTKVNEEEETIPVVRIINYTELGPPPSIAQAPAQVAVNAPVARPTVGVPVPVPDAEVSPDQTISTQAELSRQQAPAVEQGGGGGTEIQIKEDIKVEDEPDINAFIPVEKYPSPVKTVQPTYPEIAKRAGVEGKVYVKALIDKEGKVKKAVIYKSDAEVFNQSSLDATYQWIFTPAIMNNGPVSVWVVVPYNFQLKKQ
ncbi:MAG: energy transducer TonB [Bacteroidota bacterium]